MDNRIFTDNIEKNPNMPTKTFSGGTVHKLPEDLRQAIASNAKTRELWQDITPLARNE